MYIKKIHDTTYYALQNGKDVLDCLWLILSKQVAFNIGSGFKLLLLLLVII